MRKRIVSLLLGVILCCSLFAGCSLIEHNDEKDARQVIAVIDAIEDTSNGVTYKSETKRIYKSDLISAMNSYAQSYMQNYSLTLQQATERLLEELITRELLSIEAERVLKQGLVEWTQKDTNDKNRSIYSTIDSQLDSIRKEIRGEYDEDTSGGDASNNDSTSATYPTPEAETTEDDYTDYDLDANGKPQYEVKKDANGNPVKEQAVDADGDPMFDDDGNPVMVDVKVPKYIVWKPDKKDYPALHGDENQKSLDREAVQRFVALLKELTANDFKVTDDDRKQFAEDDKKITDAVNRLGWEGVYPMLGGTHYMEYLVGRNAKQSILLSKLQNYIVDGVYVTNEEVADAYSKQLRYQVETYTDNQEAYQSAVSGGNTTLLYLRDDSYFYVKHILLPFSDAQTAAYKAYKADPKNAGKDFKAYRNTQMVNETVVYEHVNGENDLDRPKTVREVFNEIYSTMAPLSVSPYEAERKFDELTYKYNTDSGAFGYGKAYAVKRNDETGHSGYMEEFYDGAMALYNGYKVGQVLPEIVVTDYGVHIMYFSQAIVPGTIRTLGDYLTPGKYETVRSSLESKILSTKQNNAFTSWQNERITYYRENKKVVRTYEKRYKSLYEE